MCYIKKLYFFAFNSFAKLLFYFYIMVLFIKKIWTRCSKSIFCSSTHHTECLHSHPPKSPSGQHSALPPPVPLVPTRHLVLPSRHHFQQPILPFRAFASMPLRAFPAHTLRIQSASDPFHILIPSNFAHRPPSSNDFKWSSKPLWWKKAREGLN